MKILKKIKEAISFVLKPSDVIFRIIEVFYDSSCHSYKVKYQAIGKGGVAVDNIETLVEELVHIHGFSSGDSICILKTYNIQRSLSSLTLLNISYAEDRTLLCIKDEVGGEAFNLPLEFFLDDDELIYGFNIEDRKSIRMLTYDLISLLESKNKPIPKKDNHLKVLNFY